MPERRQLVDTSVLARGHQPVVADRLEALRMEGKLWTCLMIDLEFVYSVPAREAAEAFEERRILPECPVTDQTMYRALEIMRDLAAAGKHRHANAADCVIAASAQLAGLSVLHYDHDFDAIAEVANVDTEWIAPPGSLDHSRKGGAI
jgi:hypothetical protein